MNLNTQRYQNNMADFTAKERMIATFLSNLPWLKKIAKNIYVKINAIIYRKPYKELILDSRIECIKSVCSSGLKSEVFFGYYDKCCDMDNKVIYHQNDYSSTKKPSPFEPCNLFVKNLNDGQVVKIDSTSAYNWQQGCRIHWVSGDLILYNVYNDKSEQYNAILWSYSKRQIIKQYALPVQESKNDNYFLSINYRRLWNMRPDYCYRCIPKMSTKELSDMDNDGIWKVDMGSGRSQLIHTLSDVINVDFRDQFLHSNHNVNHLMISPDGSRFIFVHRNYEHKKRFDRLMLSDFKNIKVLIDEHYVSHCCWIDNTTILGYLMSNGKKGFYFINVDTLMVKKCDAMSNINTGDGHPSFNGEMVVFDTYPNKSRLQRLYLYDLKKDILYPLIEVYQSTKYKDETRCDLHPRFSKDGKKIYFDTVRNNHRELCWINIDNF